MTTPLFRRAFAALVLAALVLPVHAAPTTATQVPAGSTAAIGPAKSGPGPATPNTPQGKILQNALSRDTRDTLQQAMDAAANNQVVSR